jgi:hypothetical protein
VLLHLSLQAADLILQPSSRMLEGIIDGKPNIGVAFVRGRCAPNIDFAPIRERKMDVDLIEAAGPVVSTRSLQYHPASRHAAIALLELGHMLLDRGADIRSSLHPLEIDLNRRLHGLLQELFATGNQCDMGQQMGLTASSSRVMPPKIHSPRRLPLGAGFTCRDASQSRVQDAW